MFLYSCSPTCIRTLSCVQLEFDTVLRSLYGDGFIQSPHTSPEVGLVYLRYTTTVPGTVCVASQQAVSYLSRLLPKEQSTTGCMSSRIFRQEVFMPSNVLGSKTGGTTKTLPYSRPFFCERSDVHIRVQQCSHVTCAATYMHGCHNLCAQILLLSTAKPALHVS